MAKQRKSKAAPVPAAVTPGEVCLAYKQTFSTPEGQIVAADLMRRYAFTRKTTFCPGEPEYTFFYEGQRSVLIHIGVQLDADPSAFDEPKVELGDEG